MNEENQVSVDGAPRLRGDSRMQWMARLALMAFILASAGFLSAILAMRFAIQGREVKVPRIVGVKAGDAQLLLDARGLGMKIADRVYSDLPVDYVVRQSPQPGATVKTTQRAHVVLSLGSQRVSIPELEGKSLRAARIELLRGGLQLGEVSSVHMLEPEPELVVQQNPPPKATNAGSPRVNLLVSLGPQENLYVMPDLAGLPVGEAARQLTAAGLRISKVSFIPSTDAPKGTVLVHVPSRGARIAAGASVELQAVE